MRTLKFRAWDKKGKEIRSWEYILDSLCYPSFFENGLSGEFALMQYTGLKDKNGKEIYESDILVSGVKGSISSDFKDCPKYEVVFTDGCFMMNIIPDAHSQVFINNEDCEIIGNIYENKELLNA